MTGFRKLGEESVYAGPLIAVAHGTFAAPDGTTFERDLVHHPGAVSVVPLLAGGAAVLLVRQYRAAVDRLLLEIPAGKRDVFGEAPDQTARRELVEEVGMEAGALEWLTTFFNSPGFCDEEMHVFLARDMQPVDKAAHGIEEEHMTVETVALADVPAMIDRREIVDAKTIIGLLLTRARLDAEETGRAT